MDLGPSHLPFSLALRQLWSGRGREKASGDLPSHLPLLLPGSVALNKPFPSLALSFPK